mgnify:CR=1 FL=1
MPGSLPQAMLSLFTNCAMWFDRIITATGMKDYYLSAVFVAFSVGFLLSAFRNGVSSGLDAGSDSAAKAYKARSSRPYRLNDKHKLK